MALKAIIMSVIAILIAVLMVPTIWDAVWDSALAHDSPCNKTAGQECVNSTTKTLLTLVPLIFVGAIIIGSIVMSYTGKRF